MIEIRLEVRMKYCGYPREGYAAALGSLDDDLGARGLALQWVAVERQDVRLGLVYVRVDHEVVVGGSLETRGESDVVAVLRLQGADVEYIGAAGLQVQQIEADAVLCEDTSGLQYDGSGPVDFNQHGNCEVGLVQGVGISGCFCSWRRVQLGHTKHGAD